MTGTNIDERTAVGCAERCGSPGDVRSLNAQESIMDVREAVQMAKDHVAEIFADESIANVGLEEVEFDEMEQVWAITIGFSRPWITRGASCALSKGGSRTRTFKIVRIKDESGRIQSVKHRAVTRDQ